MISRHLINPMDLTRERCCNCWVGYEWLFAAVAIPFLSPPTAAMSPLITPLSTLSPLPQLSSLSLQSLSPQSLSSLSLPPLLSPWSPLLLTFCWCLHSFHLLSQNLHNQHLQIVASIVICVVASATIFITAIILYAVVVTTSITLTAIFRVASTKVAVTAVAIAIPTVVIYAAAVTSNVIFAWVHQNQSIESLTFDKYQLNKQYAHHISPSIIVWKAKLLTWKSTPKDCARMNKGNQNNWSHDEMMLYSVINSSSKHWFEYQRAMHENSW